MSSTVETLYNVFHTTATILQTERSYTYLEGLAETGENLFHGEVIQQVSDVTKKRLNKEYQSIHLGSLEKEETRKGFQLAILKGMKEEAQTNQQMTPDSVGLFLSYLVTKYTEEMRSFTILDPAVGTGNLLTTILNQQNGKEIQSFGVDVDDILIKLAYVNANIQEHKVQLYNQDSLEPLLVDPVDLVVCDLPVGYYPNDIGAGKYQLKAKQGHSYAHHLFIEQSITYTKDGGYLFFLVPNFLFESDQSSELHGFIKDHTYIQGLLQLPLSMFKNENQAKSIFILQKKQQSIEPPKKALLANLPSFSNKNAMEQIMKQIEEWFDAEKGGR